MQAYEEEDLHRFLLPTDRSNYSCPFEQDNFEELCTVPLAPITIPGTTLRMLTWNLRYDSKPNSIPLGDTLKYLPKEIPKDEEVLFYANPREVPWSTRRITIAREVRFNQPDIIAVQEALLHQLCDLKNLFGYEYGRLGASRERGWHGEFNAIFYKRRTVSKDGPWDFFWLSETPFVYSKFPGAGSPRIATVARFHTNINDTNINERAFTLICTHWDDQSDHQRKLAASLLVWRGAHEASLHDGPVFILGDFNSPTSGKDCAGYEIMTGKENPVKVPLDFQDKFPNGNETFVFSDVGQATSPFGRSGHHATFTDFKVHERMDLKRIDFVMAGGYGWSPVHYRAGENWWDAQDMASDHRPVWADVKMHSTQRALAAAKERKEMVKNRGDDESKGNEDA